MIFWILLLAALLFALYSAFRGTPPVLWIAVICIILAIASQHPAARSWL